MTWGDEWDEVVDVVVVGSGAAGYAAALTAAGEGSTVAVLERGAAPGGTTAKSSGGAWIPNNPVMRALGLEDRRDDALRYMARLGFPVQYDALRPGFGLDASDMALLEAFYDHASRAVEHLVALRGLQLKSGSEQVPYPDYHADLPENAGIGGRSVSPMAPPDLVLPSELTADPTALVGGMVMIETMRIAGERLGVQLHLENRVVDIIRDGDGAVVGVEVHAGRRARLIGGRQGVVFGSGGFLLNKRLARSFLRGPVFGGCAAATNTGDLVDIASRHGARLGNMTNAWWDQVVVEVALRVPSTVEDIWYPFGDSMVQVNKYGHRVVNEKQVYNERSQVHFVWDPTRREYPNIVLIQIWDAAVARNGEVSHFRGLVPMPGEQVDYVITGDTLDKLADEVDQRLGRIARHTGGARLAPGFRANLKATIGRFNGFAESGFDEDFGRGETPIQRAWQGTPRPGIANPCMAPISGNGPYYAMIVGAGGLDTKGGPCINVHGQILDVSGDPIAGLYGAGNCIASPLGQGYPGAGGTIGPALTFGYLAGLHASHTARRPPSVIEPGDFSH